MYIILHLRLTICITHCMCPPVLLLPEDGHCLWLKHAGASKICIVQLVGNKFVCVRVGNKFVCVRQLHRRFVILKKK